MKIMLYLIVAIAVLFFVSGGVLSMVSRGGEAPGMLEGRLRPCPETTNCVCSECSQAAAFVMPLMCEGDANAAWAQAQVAVTDLGGEISRVEGDYLAATFQTPLFRFVDDVELHLDREIGVIHLRSASRVGRSDLGNGVRV